MVKSRLYGSVTLSANTFGQINFPIGQRKDVFIHDICWSADAASSSGFGNDEELQVQLTATSQSGIIALGPKCYWREQFGVITAAGVIRSCGHEAFPVPLMLKATEGVYVGGYSGADATLSVSIIISEAETV